jgi:hypothetical protein
MIVPRSFTYLLFLLVPFVLANGLDQSGLGIEAERRADDFAAHVETQDGIDTVRDCWLIPNRLPSHLLLATALQGC